MVGRGEGPAAERGTLRRRAWPGQDRLRGRSNQNAASDLEVAGALARTALEGCLANVAINVESIKDEHAAAGLTARAAELRTDRGCRWRARPWLRS